MAEIDWRPWASLLEMNAPSVVALAAAKDDITEAAQEPCGKVTVDVGEATQVMLTVVGNLEPYRAQIAKLQYADVALIEKLQTYALALALAQGMANHREVDPMPIEPRATALFKIRRELILELMLLQARGVVPEGHPKLRGTVGHTALVTDVRTLGTMFLDPQYSPHVGDVARIREALHAADDLMAALAKSDLLKENLRGAKLIRAAAWKLAHRAYREAQRAIQFLRFYEGDALVIAPNLHDRGNKPKHKKKRAEPAPAEGPRVFEATEVTSPKIDAPPARPIGTLGRGDG